MKSVEAIARRKYLYMCPDTETAFLKPPPCSEEIAFRPSIHFMITIPSHMDYLLDKAERGIHNSHSLRFFSVSRYFVSTPKAKEKLSCPLFCIDAKPR
jgi:hypothetical protein